MDAASTQRFCAALPARRHGPRRTAASSQGRRVAWFKVGAAAYARDAYAFMLESAERLRSTMRRELGSPIAAVLSSCVSVRDTVSMVRPR